MLTCVEVGVGFGAGVHPSSATLLHLLRRYSVGAMAQSLNPGRHAGLKEYLVRNMANLQLQAVA